MKAPGTAFDDPVLGRDPQPATMAGFVHTTADSGGVHTNSGIPNHAFYLAATALGGHAWEKAGRIWYETLRDKRLKPTATFRQFARFTVQNAAHFFGAPEREAVAAAWAEVGIRTIEPRALTPLATPPGIGRADCASIFASTAASRRFRGSPNR